MQIQEGHFDQEAIPCPLPFPASSPISAVCPIDAPEADRMRALH